MMTFLAHCAIVYIVFLRIEIENYYILKPFVCTIRGHEPRIKMYYTEESIIKGRGPCCLFGSSTPGFVVMQPRSA